jgi:Zn-finger nucleic acid-binding protein
MNRRNFGGTSGVIVDVCARHGLWFDRGELPRVLAFVERGGLERERATQAEAERQERSAARVVAMTSDPESYPSLDLGSAARELLELVVDLVRGRAKLR